MNRSHRMTSSPPSRSFCEHFVPASLVISGALLALFLTAPAALAESKTPASAKPQTTPVPAQETARGAAYYHLALAHTYEDMAANTGRQDYATRAVEEYKLALNADPTSAFLNNGLAELYFRTGRVRDAILTVQDTIKRDPKNIGAHKLLGRIYLHSLGDMQNGASQQVLDLAISEYKQISALDPTDIQSHLVLGQLYTVNHDSQAAQQEFEVAQKIDPNSEDVALNLARLYGESGDIKHAIDTLKAVPEDDRSAKLAFALGAGYDQIKDTKDAVTAYQQAVDMDPDNLDAKRALAQALLNNNQLSDAEHAYQEIAAADPQDAQALVRIAECQRRQGHYEPALATLKKAQALSTDSDEILFNEALTYDSLGRYPEATQLLQGLVSRSAKPDNHYNDNEKNNRSIFLDRLANVEREQNHTDAAVAAYKQMLPLGGEYAERGYQGEVDAYRDAKEYEKANDVARDAAKALPTNKTMQLMLAGQLADTGHAEEGLALANAQLKHNDDDRDVYLALAQIDTRLRRWKEAGEDIDKAAALPAHGDDDSRYVLFLRGALEERQKHYDAAEEQFRKILALDPNNSMTLNYLGYMLADRGVKLDDALAMLQKAVQLDPQNYAYLDSLGWVYFKLGQYPLAEENLRKASERVSTDPTVHDHLGELYEKTGRLRLAVAQWDQSLAQYARTVPADVDEGDVSKVQKKLENAKVKLARESAPATDGKH
ncbi:MAG TPA: tetratricopeptide repeat protein [Acidobacteriaceae bacterium]|jgi:tetratricopeptide (TPR) repeat protein